MIRISLRNPFFGTQYPSRGTALSVVDTGYDGFVAVPKDVFSHLGLDKLSPSRRTVVAADGHPLEMSSSLASANIPDLGRTFDGPIESAEGLDELLVGTRLLRELRVTLDYCTGTARVETCR